MEQEQQPLDPPHVLIFPLPAQGHINSMLKLAELFALAGLKTIPDGLPQDHPRVGYSIIEIFESLLLITKPILREMLANTKPPVDCIIGDGALGFILDVADELGIPIIQFLTVSAATIWAYFAIPDMIEALELPIRGNEDTDRLITRVPSMETFLRCQDLPSFCRANDITDTNLQLMAQTTRKNCNGDGLLLNTFEELEGAILSHMRTKCPKVYTIGPLHAHYKTRLAETYETSFDQSSNGLWEVDRSCLSWLDNQPNESIVYASFGSFVVLSREQIMEFWFGIVNSRKRF
ncbi:hypothetical protein DITRI_Ditri02bG0133100 [Diplodiscus trichospermus]